MKIGVWIAAVGGVGVAAIAAFALSGKVETPAEYQTARIERGPVSQTVSSAGRLNATVNVQVSTQVSGLIKELPVDYNSVVAAGQVIARIDEKGFEAKVQQARAGLAVARAKVATADAAIPRAEADIEQARSGLAAAEADVRKATVAIADAKLDLGRKRELLKTGNVPANQVDRAQAVHDTALAELSAAEARVSVQRSLSASRRAALEMAKADAINARAEVEQEAAALRYSEIDLENTFIRSPVDGVVIDRNVELGQTVAANFQAPRLFSIAQDLSKMQVETRVDEADIGQIQSGMTARFTVDAFAGQEFEGKVTQVRKQAREVDTVVTYMVVVETGNPNLRLLPGMTANVQFVIGQRRNVLRVPNAALRFRPAGVPAMAAAAAVEPERQGEETAEPAGPMAGGPASGNAAAGNAASGARRPSAAVRADRLASQLRLSDSQKQAVLALFEESDRRGRIASGGAGAGGGPSGERQAGERQAGERQAAQPAQRRQVENDLLNILDASQREVYARIVANQAANPTRPGQLWIVEGGQPKVLNVRVGMSDGSFTEVSGADLQEGQEIVVGLKYRPGQKSAPSPLSRFGL